ncbi:unnamed protein product, partial [Mesorhabditis belari]|uniref:Serpin domain-containing protein n=1 Tax=Mesorhabditis belari TaxID=2138241 RepID=A0AAF3ESK0_9BILA
MQIEFKILHTKSKAQNFPRRPIIHFFILHHFLWPSSRNTNKKMKKTSTQKKSSEKVSTREKTSTQSSTTKSLKSSELSKSSQTLKSSKKKPYHSERVTLSSPRRKCSKFPSLLLAKGIFDKAERIKEKASDKPKAETPSRTSTSSISGESRKNAKDSKKMAISGGTLNKIPGKACSVVGKGSKRGAFVVAKRRRCTVKQACKIVKSASSAVLQGTKYTASEVTTIATCAKNRVKNDVKKTCLATKSPKKKSGFFKKLWDKCKRKKKEEPEIQDFSSLIHRFIVSSLDYFHKLGPMTSNVNYIIAPIPALSALVAIFLLGDEDERRAIDLALKINQEDIDATKAILEVLHRCALNTNERDSRKSLFVIARVFLGDAHRPFLKEALATLKKYLGDEGVWPIRSSHYAQWVGKLSDGEIVPQAELAADSCCFMSGSGIRVKWKNEATIGQTMKAQFFVSPYLREFHPMFEITTAMATFRTSKFDAFSISLDPGEQLGKNVTNINLVIVRPTASTDIVNFSSTFLGMDLVEIFKTLTKAKVKTQTLLLPIFQMENHIDLLKSWNTWEIFEDGYELLAPLANVEHWTRLNLGPKGLHFMQKVIKEGIGGMPEWASPRNETELYKRHRPYSLRLDSPFQFYVTLQTADFKETVTVLSGYEDAESKVFCYRRGFLMTLYRPAFRISDFFLSFSETIWSPILTTYREYRDGVMPRARPRSPPINTCVPKLTITHEATI